MRPLWKGAISFGLISIPVRLYSATESKSMRFHLLHAEDQGRVRNKRVCSKCGQEVSWEDLVRGFEYSKDHYVIFTDEELENLDVDSINAIDVVTFVPIEQIDPIYYDKSYYVAPETPGIKAYKLLADAMEAEGQVGVAKVALRDKEHLATVRLMDNVFILETMHWPDEIRPAEFEELDKKVQVRDPEVKMARQLIQQLSGDWHPEEFRDEYRERLEALAERKVEGEEIAVAAEPT
jgi:DNA end-binding protein Ku